MNVPSSKNHVTEQEFSFEIDTSYRSIVFVGRIRNEKMSQIKVKHDNVKSSEYLYVKMFFYLDIYSMASFLYLKSNVHTTRVLILKIFNH